MPDFIAMEVSVVVCTRNRRENIIPTIRSVIDGSFADFELIVVDQSDDDATQIAVERLVGETAQGACIRYFRRRVPGKPGALNFALQQSAGHYIVLTDDDCEGQKDWLERVVEAFRENPEAACVFGQVLAAPYDPATYFIATQQIERPNTLRRFSDLLKMPGMQNFGIGANMAIRRDALLRVKGWDACIGPGAKFGSGDDQDLAVRLLLQGDPIYLCPQSRVIHYGFRRWEKYAGDMERVGGGFGAICAKYLRCGRIYQGAFRILFHFLRNAAPRLLSKNKGLAFPRGWIRGFVRSLRHPVDRQNLMYIALTDEESKKHGGHFASVVLREEQSREKK